MIYFKEENMRGGFETKLSKLNNDLIKMGGLIEEAIKNAIKALSEGDKELAQRVVKGDGEVNQAEKNIESQCLSIILREQPVAKDLRKVSGALKMVTDMERIADNAADIAEISITANVKEIFHLAEDIGIMAEKARLMVADSIKSFVENDLTLARDVIQRDDEVDELFNKIKHRMAESLNLGKSNIDSVVDTIMIIKYLERIADHAVNICEWIEFFETGEYKHTLII